MTRKARRMMSGLVTSARPWPSIKTCLMPSRPWVVGRIEEMLPSFGPAYIFSNCVGKNTPENRAEPAPRKIPNGSPRLNTIAKLADNIPKHASTTVVSRRKTTARKKFPRYCTPKNTQPKKR
jgi:hypothetical protein